MVEGLSGLDMRPTERYAPISHYASAYRGKNNTIEEEKTLLPTGLKLKNFAKTFLMLDWLFKRF